MTDKPFNYADCHPHSDGKRRAVDNFGDIHVILCVDAPHEQPVRTYRDKDGVSCSFKANGWTASGFRLVGPAPDQPRRRWVNRYQDGVESLHLSKESADCFPLCRIECICVEEVRS